MTNSVRKSWKRSSKSVERMLSPGLRSNVGTNYDTSVQRRTEREKLILQSFVLLQLNEVFADGA